MIRPGTYDLDQTIQGFTASELGWRCSTITWWSTSRVLAHGRPPTNKVAVSLVTRRAEPSASTFQQ
jgi:hypothetical protein